LSGDFDKEATLEEIAAIVEAFDAMDLSSTRRPSRSVESRPEPPAIDPGPSLQDEPVVEALEPGREAGADDESGTVQAGPVEPPGAILTDKVPAEANEKPAERRRRRESRQRQLGLFGTAANRRPEGASPRSDTPTPSAPPSKPSPHVVHGTGHPVQMGLFDESPSA
jgi:hypothetical protein